MWQTYVEYASLHQRPSCFIVAGGRPALAAAVAAPYSVAVCVIVPWVIAVLAQQRMEGGP